MVRWKFSGLRLRQRPRPYQRGIDGCKCRIRKDVFQLQDDGNHIVLFTILILLLKVGVHALADFSQFSIMPDDLIGIRAAVTQKFVFIESII